MSLFDLVYRNLIRPALFQIDPERIHDWMMEGIPYSRPLKAPIKSLLSYPDEKLSQELWGLRFENPIGLAGGFDKNGECADLWDMFGFGFVELGTVTPAPQPGNPKPRLFRYPERKALVNRMGFNNDGSERIAQRLAENLKPRERSTCIVGISIGKQVTTPVENIDQVIRDYTACLETLYPYADYFAVNVSSPNTQNLRELQQVENLDRLLAALVAKINEREAGLRKPLLVKFAPDLDPDDLKAAVDVAVNRGVDGLIATNTTNQMPGVESGGLSGAPLRERSTQVIHLIAQHTGGKIPLIGCGGIFTAEDAIEKLEAGAWLLQIYTSFIYQGPTCAKALCRGISQHLTRQNRSSIKALRSQQ